MPDQAPVPRDDVVEDVRTFVATVESTHPDPFQRAGGRFAYFRLMQSLLDDLTAEEYSERELREELAGLAAALRDAHTFVAWPLADGEIPIRLGVVDGDVRVRAVRENGRQELVGTTLKRVEGIHRDALLRRQQRLRGSETPHGDLLNLTLSLRNWRAMATLLDRTERPGRATFEFENPDGTTYHETLEPTPEDRTKWRAPSTLDRPASGGWPVYRLLSEYDVAWLRIPSMIDYRENFEYRRDSLDERNREQVRSLCRAYTGEQAPDEVEDVLGRVPSALEAFRDLAAEMERAGTETLVVDLRENTGGVRILVDLLLYILYGWDGVVTARNRLGAIRHSDHFVEERGRETFEEANEARDWDLQVGEYAIDGDDPSVDDVREDLVGSIPTFERLESPNWPSAARYTPPNVIVVTSATTFSAGFSLLAALRRLGATVVGTAPVQAPTYYGDVVSFDLPNSEITAMTATSRIETLPAGPDDVLEPDRALTAADWKDYDFDRDASVRLALDEYC